MRRMLLVVIAGTLGVLAVAPSADALTRAPVWKCRASAAHITIADQNRLEPVVANGNINTAAGRSPDRAQCVSGEAGAGNTATQLGLSADFLAASTAKAETIITPELGSSSAQSVTSIANVENLTLRLPQAGSVAIGVTVAESRTTGSCVAGVPRIDGNADGVKLTLGGTDISIDGLIRALDALLPDALVQVVPNEKVRAANGALTVRGLRLTVIPDAGGTPLLNVVVGETKVDTDGVVCGPDPSGPGLPAGVCPVGSTLDPGRVLCVIPATSGSSFGEIIVGRPFQGPSGGTVVPLDIARRQFGRTPCLAAGGRPLFAIIGTNRNDRITGSNTADRVLALAGNDQVSGGRGNDCIEGGSGRDILSGSLGADRIFGGAGNDALNGAGGNDRLSGGSGNDTINAGFGADRTFGGPGNDAINIATQGPRATANCGTGRDKVRFNAKERRGIRGCEIRFEIRDR